MTRRIAWAILLSAWTALIIGGLVAYFATRQTLLAELDESLILRASSLPQVLGVSRDGIENIPPGDRYIIRNEVGQTVARPETSSSASSRPIIISRSFGRLPGGGRVRSITLSAVVRNPTSGDSAMTIVYSGSADRFDQTLNRLGLVLTLACAGCGIVAAALAVRITRVALRPLEQTAATIGKIDEMHLDRRIDAAALPPELIPMADRLNEMMARLELAFGQRQQFLADAAHELRTPIAALMTNLEVTLRKPRDADTLISALRTSLTDVKLLRRLIERLMEHVRANTTAAQKPAERLNVSALLDECARLAESIAQAKEVDIIRDYANDIFFTTQADRLRSVAMNLLANAIEYNRPGGTVTLSAHLSAKDLQISIADSGPGIAPHDLAHIFEPFYRGDVSHRPDGDHLGLGLFLVRSHIQAMGGACSVESEPGKGTVFHITLPQSATDAAPLVLAPIH